MSERPEIVFPVVLFHDDGARVHRDRGSACASREAVDIRNSPKWFGYGYDALGNGVRLVLIGLGDSKSKFSGAEAKIELRLDPEVDIEADTDAVQWLHEYLAQSIKGESATRAFHSARDLLGEVFRRSR